MIVNVLPINKICKFSNCKFLFHYTLQKYNFSQKNVSIYPNKSFTKISFKIKFYQNISIGWIL